MLTWNQLTSLPAEIKQLQNLEMLYLQGNKLPEEHIKELRRAMPECSVYCPPPTAEDYFNAGKYQEAYAIHAEKIQKDTSHYNAFYLLCKFALFTNQPKIAIKAAHKTLRDYPKTIRVEAFLATAYLLDNQWPEAEKLYKKLKGKYCHPQFRRPCNKVILQDLAKLEAAGVWHEDFERVREMLEESDNRCSKKNTLLIITILYSFPKIIEIIT